MPQLHWSEALELGLDVMDDTHREFVELLARCESSPDALLPATWDALVRHTEDHFGREDAWMRETGFASVNCHTTQHRVVLEVLREGSRLARQGQLQPVREMVHELALWFPRHAQTMDAALALHLRNGGDDLHTGRPGRPGASVAPITTCGSGGCG
ncbi:MAG TPA: hemerythrin domain-containing protein [Ramlibacter sp.]|jgi:hemerythrin-like metal-binding protein|uniref:hemerythrin domain-containing protein n=1 Tax=Ramlibacter sp. TaxID=1917967 RepID=UPI002D50DD17|nr:hemerythrin domain-containing protein [Ramlibacter sp.]HZY20597.1 hemerythrin domain-containing protein [Ramlibacter sp.]